MDKRPLRIGRLRALLDTPKLLANPLPVIRGHLAEGNGIYQSYLGPIPICLTDLPEAATHILQSNHRNYGKPRLTYGKLTRLLGNGLLTSEGERWRNHRKIIQPGFHPRRLLLLADTMVGETNATLDWIATQSGPIDWAAETPQLTSRIIGRTLFGQSLPIHLIDFFRDTIGEAQGLIAEKTRSPLAGFWAAASGREWRMEQNLRHAKKTCLQMITERRRSLANSNVGPGEHDDLLQMLVEAKFDDTGDGLSDEEILDEIITFYVAGHETSSQALNWFVWELGQHPELQTELADEVRQIGEKVEITVDDLARLPLLKSALKETLRLHPPAWIVDREPLSDDLIDGYQIPRGLIIGICIYSLHRRADLWKAPDEFVIDRFLEPHPSRENWIPFGIGPRKCIGQHFAMMEMLLVLAQLLKRFDFKVIAAESVGEKPLITLGMDKPLLTEFTKVNS